MDLQQITDILLEYVGQHFDIAGDPDFTADVNLFDYGFIDSLGATEIIAYLEERFQVEVSQKDIVLYPMSSIDEIAAVVAGKLG